MNYFAPLSSTALKELRTYAQNVRATAQLKKLTIDAFSERHEADFAREHFGLGCWLHYYSSRVGLDGPEGLKSRIDCLHRILIEPMGKSFNPGDNFYTVFDFGRRHFDAIFEMGDSDQVIDALRSRIDKDDTGRLKHAFETYGWPLVAVPVEDVNLTKARTLRYVVEVAVEDKGECHMQDICSGVQFGLDMARDVGAIPHDNDASTVINEITTKTLAHDPFQAMELLKQAARLLEMPSDFSDEDRSKALREIGVFLADAAAAKDDDCHRESKQLPLPS